MGSEPLEINFEAYAYKFHENEAEIGRLERGIGKLETAHTKELLLHWLPEQTTIYDVVGGVGYYANWLAGLGHKVTMLELVPAAVEYAKSYQTSPTLPSPEMSDICLFPITALAPCCPCRKHVASAPILTLENNSTPAIHTPMTPKPSRKPVYRPSVFTRCQNPETARSDCRFSSSC